MKFCPECGSKLTSESAKICSECGFRLSNLLPEANEKASNTCNLNENAEPELGEFEKSMCFFEYTEEPDESYVIQRCIDDFAKTILVPEGVSEISASAFREHSCLEEIVLPRSLISIGESAFEGCKKLKKVTLYGAIELGEKAFYMCTSLKSVSLPANLLRIEADTFSGCWSLQDVEIPEGLGSISDRAFYYCKSLKSVKLPSSLVFIGVNAFSQCQSLRSADMLDGVRYIDDGAFSHCSQLKEFTIPKSVNYMGCSVFFGCTSLKSVKKIGNTKILYFGELAKICELVGNPWNFSSELPFGCELVSKQRSTSAKPKAQKKAATKSQGSDSEANAFDNLKCETLATGSLKLLAYLDRSVKKVVLPESITEIRAGAFENCTELSDIELPSTLIYIGVSAFENCSSLKAITIPRSVDNIDCGAFEGCCNLERVAFEDPNGWYYEDDEAEDPDDCEIDISPEDLKDPQKAAELLKTRDRYITWLKRD